MAPNLEEAFLQLSPEHKKMVHKIVCQKALDSWRLFMGEVGQISYNDSVVGMYHVLDGRLPGDAFHEAFNSSSEYTAAVVSERYLEPITALQDADLELPNGFDLAYYGIYNAFRKYALHESVDDWLIVNQALAILPEEEWEITLISAIRQAGE
jgi:hypothetical protein